MFDKVATPGLSPQRRAPEPQAIPADARKTVELPADAWVPSACNICYSDCSILVHRVNGTVVKIEGNPASPVGDGRICAKGLTGMMVLYDPNRLNYPLRRTNPQKGIGVDPMWQRISWEEAFQEMVARLKKLHAEDPRQLVLQSTTTLAPMGRFLNLLGWAFGTPNMWVAGGGLHCGNGAHSIGGMMHASWSLVPDFKYCNYALYFGASKGHGAGHASTPNQVLAADARVRGMRMVVVDPMCNFAAAKANEWVPIRVGTDAALALAIANCLVNEFGIYDAPYIKAKTNGPYLIKADGRCARETGSGKPLIWDLESSSAKPYDDPSLKDPALLGEYRVGDGVCRPAFALLKEHLTKYPPTRAEEITGIAAAHVRRLAREFGEAARVGSTIVIDGVTLPYRPAAAIFFRGAQGHKNSEYNCLAVELLNQIVGSADVVGGALGFNPVCLGHPSTGRPRYVPQADVDGLMRTGAWATAHKPYPLSEPRMPETMGLLELFPLTMMSPFMMSADQEQWWQRLGLPYRPKIMINWGANPLMSVGNKETVAKSLSQYEFIISFDIFLNEFSDFADIVLPDTSFLEVLESRPNFPFITNHPAGPGNWGWPIRQPVVTPIHERRPAREAILELAYRIGLGPEINMAANAHYGLAGPNMLDPEKTYRYEEIADHDLKDKFGPDHGLQWFKEHGVMSWPKQPREAYWRPFVDVRVPIYWEFMLDMGEKIRAICEPRGILIDLDYYQPLPEWLPCPSHQLKDPSYGLYAFYYRDAIHVNGFTMENPWLDEVARMDPYSYRIAINSATGRRLGIKDNDNVCVETSAGRRVKGQVWLTEGIHPEGVGIAACAGHWSKQQPVAMGKGIFFNDLLEVDFEHSSPANLNLDLCAKVRVYKCDPQNDHQS